MKYLKNSAFAVIALFMIIQTAGCGGEPPKPSKENVRATAAMGALEQMRKAFIGRDMQGVLDHVSPALENGYSDFSARLRQDIERFERVELKMSVERVELTDNRVSVVFHWFGKWWDRDGKMIEGRGNAVFSFGGAEDRTLYNIVGDSPFSMIR